MSFVNVTHVLFMPTWIEFCLKISFILALYNLWETLNNEVSLDRKLA